jgi:hypothetical protein
MATHPSTRGLRGKGPVSLPRHRARTILFTRAPQRVSHTDWLGDGGRVRLTHQLRRDLEWWLTVPTQHNGRSIYKPIETAYLHADSSDYG